MSHEEIKAAKQAFDSASGLLDEQIGDVDYVRTLLTDRTSMLGAVAAGVLGTLVLGGGLVAGATLVGAVAVAVFPGMTYLLGQTLRVIFVPGSVGYQSAVNLAKRKERRHRTQQLLLGKLADPHTVRQETRVDPFLAAFVSRQADMLKVQWREGLESFRGTYLRMLERLEALRELATKTDTSLSLIDIEKLNEATNDYLRLVFAKHTITERREGDQDRKIAEKILAIDQSLESTTATAVRGKLEKSRTQLERIAKRRAQLPGRDAVISAQLMAMGETFEELYHQVSADPTGAGISDFLTEATDRLSIEEELSFSVADELENGPDGFTKKRMAVVAAKARRQAEGTGAN